MPDEPHFKLKITLMMGLTINVVLILPLEPWAVTSLLLLRLQKPMLLPRRFLDPFVPSLNVSTRDGPTPPPQLHFE